MLLNEMRQLCKQKADCINGWRKLSKSELCNEYIKYKDTDKSKADSYMSALLYNYWYMITYMYNHQYNILSPEDCYNIIVDSVLYVMEKKAWLNESSSLYGDPKGPEKAINKVLDCRKINEMVASTRTVRKANYHNSSLDALDEESSDGYFLRVDIEPSLPNVVLDNFIKEKYTKKDYVPAFALDAIMHNDFRVVSKENGKVYSQFSNKGVGKFLTHMSDMNCEDFANRYHLDNEDVKKNVKKYIKTQSASLLDFKVERLMKRLSRDEKMLNCLR